MTAFIRTLIVDDEPLVRQALKTLLSEHVDIEIIDECSNGFEAVKAANHHRPDLIFLDIQMPKLDGFDVVELLGETAPIIIFVTAFDEYALRAFEVQALDYLLKPVNQSRLEDALSRVRDRLNCPRSESYKELMIQQHDRQTPLIRLLVREGSNIHIIPTSDITHIEAQDDYVCLHTSQGTHLKNKRLSHLEKQLDQNAFCRIHRSYLLNLNYLVKIESQSKDSKAAVLKDGQILPVSRSGYALLREHLK